MKTQYHFEVVFIRLTLKKGLKNEGNLHLALLENYDRDSNQNVSAENNFHRLKIRKIQRIIDLEKLTPFKFKKDQDNKTVDNTAIQLNIEEADENIEFIELKTAQMIQQFQSSKKSIFEYKFEWSLGELQVKVYLVAKEVEALVLNIFDPTLQKVSSFKSNSMSRTKRPPELNISRKGALATSQAKSINSIQQKSQDKAKTQQILKAVQAPFKNIAVLPQKKAVSPRYNQPETPSPFYPQTFSALALLKRKEKKTEVENEHVKGLIESHHPNEQHDVNTSKLSIKLKAVIILLVIGFLFLLVDTLTDRRIKKFFKKSAPPVKHGHPQKKEEKGSGRGKQKKGAKH